MRCGSPATHTKRKKFSWHPSWITILIFAGLLPYILLARVFRKEQEVAVPLCDSHRYHWLLRNLLVPLALAVILLAGCAGLAALPQNMSELVFGIGGLALLGWLVLAAVAHETSIHPTEITDTRITLAGASPDFIDALRHHPRRPGRDPFGG